MNTEKKLPEEFKKNWVAALRSGDYEQYRGGSMCNRDGTKFCCLGVARIIFGVPKENVNGRGCYNEGLPEILLGYADGGSVAEKLVSMNDLDGKSFSEIADYIEENL